MITDEKEPLEPQTLPEAAPELPEVEPTEANASAEASDAATTEAEPTEAETSDAESADADYTHWTKDQFVALFEDLLQQARNRETADFKAIDVTLREAKPAFDHLKGEERREALERYLAEGGDEEGFAYKPDALTQKADSLYGQVRTERNQHFQGQERDKERNFQVKTELLTRLRTLVEADEQNTTSEKSWKEFKQIQDEWKGAGNVHSPHNDTLWKTYHALVDRYFNNRNIYFELKELDRKRNLQHKIELCERVEKLAASVQDEGQAVSGKMLDEATELFEEYKHVGPAPKEANEELWQRFKAAMDVLYARKREQNEAQKGQAEEIFKLKSDIAEVAATFTTFQSTSINDWNDKTKALLALQEQWNAVKGPMPRDKGRELSQKFWSDVKAFFRNKGEFFRQLEAKRDENLKAKIALCERAEAVLAEGTDSGEATNTIIELQRQWKTIGHVPEKMRNKIFDRFKAACDAFFDRKRGKNATVEKEFEDNLAQKKALCEEIETEAKAGAPDLGKLNAFKARWSGIGFVPRGAMQSIQQRYIKAINQYVSAIGQLSGAEKQQLVLESEVELVRQGGGGTRDFRGQENDIRRRIKTLEDDIALTQNNLAFFAKSKNADKLRADFEKKIEASQRELDQLKHQLRVVREAEG
jgi:hypothetical protein